MGRYHEKLVPLVRAFEGFRDLEDDDGDEDEEDYRLSWTLRARTRLMNLTIAKLPLVV